MQLAALVQQSPANESEPDDPAKPSPATSNEHSVGQSANLMSGRETFDQVPVPSSPDVIIPAPVKLNASSASYPLTQTRSPLSHPTAAVPSQTSATTAQIAIPSETIISTEDVPEITGDASTKSAGNYGSAADAGFTSNPPILAPVPAKTISPATDVPSDATSSNSAGLNSQPLKLVIDARFPSLDDLNGDAAGAAQNSTALSSPLETDSPLPIAPTISPGAITNWANASASTAKPAPPAQSTSAERAPQSRAAQPVDSTSAVVTDHIPDDVAMATDADRATNPRFGSTDGSSTNGAATVDAKSASANSSSTEALGAPSATTSTPVAATSDAQNTVQNNIPNNNVPNKDAPSAAVQSNASQSISGSAAPTTQPASSADKKSSAGAPSATPVAHLPAASSAGFESSPNLTATPQPSTAISTSVKPDSVPELPKTHQVLDAALPPQADPPTSGIASNADGQLHVGLHTDAFGSVEIHTVVQQSQVGITVHGDRDIARWFSSEVASLESGLNKSHLNLTAVDFASGRSGAQSAGGFQQGQPRQNFARTPGSISIGGHDQTDSRTPAASGFISSDLIAGPTVGRVSIHA